MPRSSRSDTANAFMFSTVAIAKSANRQALRRGRQWLIAKGKLQVGEAEITLANAA